MTRYLIEGGAPLKGRVRVSGSKNAALPLIAATFLTDEECVLHDVPDISDVRVMLSIAEDLGSTYTFENNTLRIRTPEVKSSEIALEKARKLRTSLMFLAPLLHRTGETKIPFPGGCNIGKRPIDSHLNALEGLGAVVHRADDLIHLTADGFIGNLIRIVKLSVTGTETALLAAAAAEGETQLRLAAAEPHVQDVAKVVQKMGAQVEGIGTNVVTIQGAKKLTGFEHRVTPDYIEAGTFVIAGLVTKGNVVIENIDVDHLDVLWEYLDQMGAKYELRRDAMEVEVFPTDYLSHVDRVRSGVYPDFPTDLLAPMAVLLTQCDGISRVFETVYESRLNYTIELEKMGVKTEILNSHEAIIVGPAKLQGNPVASWDLRAGTAMVLAGLAAEGKTEVSNIYWIDRGYERFEDKLTALGGTITRIEEDA